jgi:hypothetical protein
MINISFKQTGIMVWQHLLNHICKRDYRNGRSGYKDTTIFLFCKCACSFVHAGDLYPVIKKKFKSIKCG